MKKNIREQMQIINLEHGMPTSDTAKKQMIASLEIVKRQGGGAVKLIHGYGSSGQGGVIRTVVQKSLELRLANGWLKGYVPGEKWDIFDEGARRILDEMPDARYDADLGKSNRGISIVLI